MFAACTLLALAAGARADLAGPIPAQVVAVIDGDTIEVRAEIWLDQFVQTRIRLAGIDAPELRGGCAEERALAARARDLLAARLGDADGHPARVRLYDLQHGKFAGRVLARVVTAGGEDLGQSLIDLGLARAYGGGARLAWCTAS